MQYSDGFTRASAFILKVGRAKDRFLYDIKNSNSFRFRVAGVAAAVVLGIFALMLGFSLLGAVFGIRAFNPALGDFFSRSYGILAFFIPVFLGYAAFILADRRWRPGKIFTLNVSLFPFLTLGIGFILMRDFDNLSRESAFLDFFGRTGFGIFIVLLTFLQVVGLQMLKNTLFPLTEATVSGKRRVWRLRKQGPFLPPPNPEFAAESTLDYILVPESGPPRTEFTETCTEAPITTEEWVDVESGPDRYVSSGREKDAVETIEFELPEVRPLSSPIALEYLGDSVPETTTLGESDVELELDELYLSGHDDEADSAEERELRREYELAIEREGEHVGEEEIAAAIQNGMQAQKPESPPAEPLPRPPERSHKKKYGVPLDVLNQYPDGEYWVIDQSTRDAAMTLKETLEEFKIQAEVTGIRKGPVITMFEILPAPGVKLSRIVNLQDNIALRLAASSVRIVAPIPGKHAVGIEVPNAKRNIVSFREIIEGELQREGKRPEIPVVMGKDITGEAQTIDLTQTPHLLIAGATGAGKSVCVNSMILSILYRLPPTDCRLILIDPKIVELKLYNDIPHLLTPVITEPKRAFQALQYCIFEMERRYACLDSMGVRDIRNYNKRIKERNIAQEKMPYIVIIIDEFADLMATTGKELESTVARLAAMSRAVGIHLVLATQRPSIDVITGLIKANIPSRIAFMVASKMDSRIIIDMVGAEKLLGKGDMLYSGVVDPFPTRMQGAFVSEDEVEAVVAYVKTLGEPDYIDDEIFFDDDEDGADPAFLSEGDDPLYEKALEIVVQQGKASASYIQRRLKIGYNRAARLVEIMEHQGVVGPAQGSRPRELLRGV